MASATADRLAAVQLSESKRRTIERFASRLSNELGDDLRALWLYGSRVRGEAHAESDVDLLVIANGGRDRYRRIAGDLGEAAAIAEGESPFSFSVHTHDVEWLRGRREINSFFIQEVDRDKVVLVGSALGVSPRSQEFMQQARDRLADAQAITGTAHPAVIVSAAYYGMLYAARAALSERGEYAKTHSGTWTLFSQVFVAPGEFEQRLSALARRAKDAREEGDYEAAPPSAEEATEFVRGAADFITAIELLLAP